MAHVFKVFFSENPMVMVKSYFYNSQESRRTISTSNSQENIRKKSTKDNSSWCSILQFVHLQPLLYKICMWPNFPHLEHRSILFFEAMEGWVLVMSRQKMSWVFTLMDICRALHEVPDLHARINMFQDSPDSSEYWGMGSPLLSLNSSWEWGHIWWTLGIPS